VVSFSSLQKDRKIVMCFKTSYNPLKRKTYPIGIFTLSAKDEQKIICPATLSFTKHNCSHIKHTFLPPNILLQTLLVPKKDDTEVPTFRKLPALA
jgi:hypothetical protein